STKRLVEPRFRTQELLYDLRCALYTQLVSVRSGSKPGDLDFLSSTARLCRRGPGSFGKVDAGRCLSAGQTRSGLWALQYGDRACSGTRTNSGRMDNG